MAKEIEYTDYKHCLECGADINGAPVCCLCMKYPYNPPPLCDPCFDKKHHHRRRRTEEDSL